MKRLLLGLVLGTAALAHACKNEVPEFKSRATDGKIYSKAGLAGHPTIFVFMKLGCPSNPEAIPDFNKLATSLRGRVQVVGIINSDLDSAKKYATQLRIDFPLIPDPKKTILKGFGAKRSLEMTYSAPKSGEAKYPKIWEGYSQAMVQEILSGVQHHGVKVPKLNLGYFPKEKRAGCSL